MLIVMFESGIVTVMFVAVLSCLVVEGSSATVELLGVTSVLLLATSVELLVISVEFVAISVELVACNSIAGSSLVTYSSGSDVVLPWLGTSSEVEFVSYVLFRLEESVILASYAYSVLIVVLNSASV